VTRINRYCKNVWTVQGTVSSQTVPGGTVRAAEGSLGVPELVILFSLQSVNMEGVTEQELAIYQKVADAKEIELIKSIRKRPLAEPEKDAAEEPSKKKARVDDEEARPPVPVPFRRVPLDLSRSWWLIICNDRHHKDLQILFAPSSVASEEKRQKMLDYIYEHPNIVIGIGEVLNGNYPSLAAWDPKLAGADELFCGDWTESPFEEARDDQDASVPIVRVVAASTRESFC
jgi:hypothetical protein